MLAVAFGWDGEVGRIEGGCSSRLYDASPTSRPIRHASLTVVGFATAFELVVLAWSSARRGISDAVVAAVVGRYAYNATMTLGAAAAITPLGISDASLLRLPMLGMIAALVLVIGLSYRDGRLARSDTPVLLVGYALFIGVSVAVG